MANKALVDAQNNVNAKQKALADAQKALKDLQDQASGAAGFFKAIADNKDNSESLREDAQTAYNIITGQPNAYQNITVEWAKEAVKLGKENDSTSLSNIEKRSEEHTSELQSRFDLVCRLLLETQNDR